MTTEKLDFSLILTTYNEAHIITEDVAKIVRFLDKLKYNYEIILVEDCGKDNAKEVIKDIVENKYRDHNISYIFNEQNMGRGRSVEIGFSKAKGNIIGFIDIDLEVSHYFIPQMLDAITEEGYDGAFGRRLDTFGIRSLHRWLATKVYVSLVKFFLHTPTADSEAGYKFFKRSSYDKIAAIPKDNGWFWDTEVMYWTFKKGLRIKEVPVIFIERPDKKSTVRLFSDSVNQFKKLVSFRPKED